MTQEQELKKYCVEQALKAAATQSGTSFNDALTKIWNLFKEEPPLVASVVGQDFARDMMDHTADATAYCMQARKSSEEVAKKAETIEATQKCQSKSFFTSSAAKRVMQKIIRLHGQGTTVRAIILTREIGFKSISTVHGHLKELETLGYIKKVKKSSNDVRIVPLKNMDGSEYIDAHKETSDIAAPDEDIRPEDELLNVNEANLLRQIAAAHEKSLPISVNKKSREWGIQVHCMKAIFDALKLKGYVEVRGKGSASQWVPLKNEDGKDYTPPEKEIINGVEVTKCPPRYAAGFINLNSPAGRIR